MSEAIGLNPYIRSRRLDHAFIIFSPIIAFLFIAVFSKPRFMTGDFLFNNSTPEWLMIAALLLTHSHIMLVFIRSHLNSDVRKRFPFRFLSIPLFLLLGLWASPTIFGIGGFIALYWDEWHSLMQTFGFGRIYDVKLGNNPHTGRWLDIGLAFTLGLLPHVLLLTFLPEQVRIEGLMEALALHPDTAAKYGHWIHSLKMPLLSFGFSYLVFYVLSYRKLISQGYVYSRSKLLLFLSTGFSAIMISSFYTISDAAYFGNIYHALQYYFIVYVSEGQALPKRVGWKKEHTTKTILWFAGGMLLLALVFAVIRAKTESTFGFLGAFWLSCSLLHFWYDGFIWSVRKKDI